MLGSTLCALTRPLTPLSADAAAAGIPGVEADYDGGGDGWPTASSKPRLSTEVFRAVTLTPSPCDTKALIIHMCQPTHPSPSHPRALQALARFLSASHLRAHESGADGCPPLHLCCLTPRGRRQSQRELINAALLLSTAASVEGGLHAASLHRRRRRLSEELRRCTAICNKMGKWGPWAAR